jgi:hypothetical protein
MVCIFVHTDRLTVKRCPFAHRDDVIVLSASGTAATGDLNFMLDLDAVGMFGPPYIPTNGLSAKLANKGVAMGDGSTPELTSGGSYQGNNTTCSLVHLPSPEISLPYSCRVNKCNSCLKAPVPDIMFATVEPPTAQLDIVGRGCLLQAKVLRLKRDQKGESNAKEISDALPFIEYEIHRQLLNKLKVKGMNAVFGLKTSFTMSDRAMVATATATGVFLAALAPPTPPRLVMTSATAANHRDDQEYLQRMQRRLEEKIAENINYYGLNQTKNRDTTTSDDGDNETDFEAEPSTDHDLLMGNKDTCVLEVILTFLLLIFKVHNSEFCGLD